MKKFLITLKATTIIILLFITSCDSRNTSYQYPDNNSYEEVKETLEDKEKSNPLNFISADGTYKKNMFGEWVIKTTITNSATIANYKDIELEVYFYSKTKTLLGKENHVIYEYFPAGKSKNIKIKTYGYEQAKQLGWEIVGAKAVD